MSASCAGSPAIILMADDDEEDILLVREAFAKSRLLNDLHAVVDGVELMDYLRHTGRYSDPASAPRPDIILLDLNMPKKDGREALKEIKADPGLKDIPVIVLTSSKGQTDILKTYELGANSFITKPVTFQSMCEVIAKLGEYWFQIVKLPHC
jgi:two-component system, response regulator